MQERFTLDRDSFEQFLCSTSLIQELKTQLGQGGDSPGSRQLNQLVDTQLAIENETLDFDDAIKRVVDLASDASAASGSALWLFQGDALVRRAASGSGIDEPHLEACIMSQLEAHTQFDGGRQGVDFGIDAATSHDPGSVKSLLVVPVVHARAVVGALAVVSREFEAFNEHHATRLKLLSGLVTNALSKAAEAELRKSVTEERAAMLKAISEIMPALAQIVETSPQTPVRKNAIPLAVGEHSRSELPHKIVQGLSMTGMYDGNLALASLGFDEEGAELAPCGIAKPATAGSAAHKAQIASSEIARAASRRIRVLAVASLARVRRSGERLTALALASFSKVKPSPARMVDLRRGVNRLVRHRVRVRIRVPLSVLHKLRTMSVISGAAGVILFAASFLALTTVDNSSNPNAALLSSSGASFGTIDTADAATVAPSVPKTPVPKPLSDSGPASHRQFTDAVVASELRSLSRFEVESLRRRALFGDDRSALVLGMAYETGTLVRQDCKKAAALIAQAASDGNAAAQYNLGLRYRTGDGVPLDGQAARKWLAKAAAYKYAPAKIALESAR